MYAYLETNSAIVTKGEWKSVIKFITEKHPRCNEKIEGKDCNVFALARVYRNETAHKDPSTRAYLAGLPGLPGKALTSDTR